MLPSYCFKLKIMTCSNGAILDGMLLDWLKEVGDPILAGPIRTPYYEMAMADFADR